jgi:hypothetical protein
MSRRTAAGLVLVLLTGAAGAPAPAGDKRPPAPAGARYSMLSVGDTAILLDAVTGQTWVLQRPAGAKGPVWVPIERREAGTKGLPDQQPRKEVPLVREIDLSKIGLDPAGRPEGEKGQEIRFGRGYEYPSSLDFAPISLADLGRYVHAAHGRDAVAMITRQIDPEQQQLLLVRWYSWAAGTDKLTVEVHKGRVEFTLHLGLSLSMGHGRPNPCGRLFAVRKGARWVGWSQSHPRQPQPAQKPGG